MRWTRWLGDPSTREASPWPLSVAPVPVGKMRDVAALAVRCQAEGRGVEAWAFGRKAEVGAWRFGGESGGLK